MVQLAGRSHFLMASELAPVGGSPADRQFCAFEDNWLVSAVTIELMKVVVVVVEASLDEFRQNSDHSKGRCYVQTKLAIVGQDSR